MKKYNYLVSSYDDINKEILNNKLNKNEEYLIIMHISERMKNEGITLLEKLKENFKRAKIAGCSTCYVIYKGITYFDKILISFITTESIDIQVESFSYKDVTPEELAVRVVDKMCKEDTKVMLNFFTADFQDDIRYLSSFERYSNNKVKICGGKGGYVDEKSGKAYLFTNEVQEEKSLVVVAFSGKRLKSYTGNIMGNQPLSQEFTITDMNGLEIKSIDGENVVNWLKKVIGEEEFLEYKEENLFSEIFSRFNIVLSDHNGSSRFLTYDIESEKLQFVAEHVKVGQKFRVAYMNPMDSAKENLEICKALRDIPVEIMFFYSCVFREIYLNKVSGWEFKPYASIEPCGAFMFGELSNVNGYNESLNGSLTILAISENEVYMDIDVEAFKNVRNIEVNDNNNLLMKIIKLQERFSKVQRDAIKSGGNNKNFVFPNTLRANIDRFIIDNKDCIYDKACYIMIERGEFAAYIIGEKNFSLVVDEMMKSIEMFLSANVREGTFAIYMYSAYSFVIVALKELPRRKFMKIVEEMYARFGIIKYKEFEFTCVSRFIVVLEQIDLIDKIQFTLFNSQNTLSRFIVYDSELGVEQKAQDEMHMVSVIHEAIKNDLVVPYFQPLHDNFTSNIAKFEALMRLKDLDGRVYTPNVFMDIAKEYRLYIPLSKLMISKVFSLFRDREETVSINLSAYDINSKVITDMIFKNLDEIGRAENFVFEILESENFREFSVLMNFINKVREYGVKIAVDDFGSGYSNMMEIARLQPDYIKIDGQIIKGLLDNELNQKVAKNISQLAKLFNISLVAEYVENESLQDYIYKEKIRYSQGYHFSPPVVYEEIDKFLKKNK